jgi:hypothetical protein
MPRTLLASTPNHRPGSTRRQFLQRSAGIGVLGSLGALGAAGRALATQAEIGPDLVRLSDEIEPIVRVLERAPRETVMEAAAGLLRSGVGYQPFMAALYLAGIRNVDSRSAGSRFHCVYVIHSAHQMALAAPPEERLLPLFWALDEFKAAQQMLGRPMRPLRGPVPSGAAAIESLHAAVRAWDQNGAEAALAGMARSCTPEESFEALWRLGALDFRPIGHKAIFVANTWRTLHTIGWQHAEPAFRSLGQALASYGPTAVNNGLAFDNQSHRLTEDLARTEARELPADWAEGAADPLITADAATAAELIGLIRRSDEVSACRMAIRLLRESKLPARGLWDIVHLAARELMLRRRGIAALHAVTSIHALHYGFRAARGGETRLFLLLQAVGWLCHFAWLLRLTGDADEQGSILKLASPLPDGRELSRHGDDAEAGDAGDAAATATAQRILAGASRDPRAAACAAFDFAQRHDSHTALFDAARRLVFTRAADTHDYKYPAAAFEDIAAVAPRWRPHMLAATVLHVPDPAAPESAVIQRAREAVIGL